MGTGNDCDIMLGQHMFLQQEYGLKKDIDVSSVRS